MTDLHLVCLASIPRSAVLGIQLHQRRRHGPHKSLGNRHETIRTSAVGGKGIQCARNRYLGQTLCFYLFFALYWASREGNFPSTHTIHVIWCVTTHYRWSKLWRLAHSRHARRNLHSITWRGVLSDLVWIVLKSCTPLFPITRKGFEALCVWVRRKGLEIITFIMYICNSVQNNLLMILPSKYEWNVYVLWKTCYIILQPLGLHLELSLVYVIKIEHLVNQFIKRHKK